MPAPPTPRQYLAAFVAALLLMGALDFVWIGVLMTDFYKERMGWLMLDKPRLDGAALFYLLYNVGIVYFAVRPGLLARAWKTAAVNGALFGLVAYGTYDLTNLATVKNWAVDLTLADMGWGTLLSAIAASAGYFAARALARD